MTKLNIFRLASGLWSLLLLVACQTSLPPSPPPTTTPTRSNLDRVAGLLGEYEVLERPLPFPAADVSASSGRHYVTPDEFVDILLFDFDNAQAAQDAVPSLAALGVHQTDATPRTFIGYNGTTLFVVQNIAPPESQENARWVVTAVVSSLAGEE